MILTNANIFSEGHVIKGSLILNQGKIQAIDTESTLEELSQQGENIFDCQDNLVLPGFVDCHVHFRDLEQEEKETLETGSKAALSGGVTTVLTMPNTKPALTTSDLVKQYSELSRELFCNIGVIGGIGDGFSFEEFAKMQLQGIWALKVYPGNQSAEVPLEWDPRTQTNTEEILAEITNAENSIQSENWRALFNQAKELNLPIMFHSEIPFNSPTFEELYSSIFKWANQDPNISNPKLFAHSETHSIDQDELKLIQMITSFANNIYPDPTKSPHLHFCHVTDVRCIDLIIQYKEKGYPFTYEVTPHHLLLNYDMRFSIPAFAKVLDPIRSSDSQAQLWQRAQSGSIDMIGTDHAPHTYEEKLQEFQEAPAGFPGVDVALPLLLTQVALYHISLENVVRYYAERPCEIFQIPNKGFLRPDYDSDIVIVERCDPYPYDPSNSFSKATWSPYEGSNLYFKVKQVFLGGELVYDRDQNLITPKGQFIYKSRD